MHDHKGRPLITVTLQSVELREAEIARLRGLLRDLLPYAENGRQTGDVSRFVDIMRRAEFELNGAVQQSGAQE